MKPDKIEYSESSEFFENSENSENSIVENSPKKRKNSRAKGQTGERQVAKYFVAAMAKVEDDLLADLPLRQQEKVVCYSEEVKRNTLQSDRGGYDLVGCPLIAPEIKFCDTLLLDTWWVQTKRQAKHGLMPILIYRKTRARSWRCRTYLSLQFPEYQLGRWTVADIEFQEFLAFYQSMYRAYLVTSLSPQV